MLRQQRLEMFIGGKWLESSTARTLESFNPYQQKVWAIVPDASAEDAKAAVTAAREAFDSGPWRRTTPQQRAALMRKLGDLMARDAERLARIESCDHGKLLRDVLGQTRYGFAAGVWTQNLQRAHRVASQLRAGTVWVNAYKVTAPYGPFGGFKHSGIGRENGRDGLNEYLETKTVWIKMS